jgi:adenylate cyclase
MRRLLAPLQRRMLVKVFLATAFVVAQALVVMAYLHSRDEVASLERATQASAQQLADLVVGSMEHTMLQGDGIAVKELVDGFHTRVPQADIRVFDRRGQEVFGALPPPPQELPAELQAAMAAGARRVLGDRVFRPIPNEERCHDCHDPAPPLRGLLVLERRPEALRDQRGPLAARLLREAFVHVMTARQQKLLDGFFEQVQQLAPSIAGLAVYDREGDLAFGKDVTQLPEGAVMASLEPGASVRGVDAPGVHLELVPLPMEARCRSCHKGKEAVRGVLVVALGAGVAEQELEAIVDASLRVIMMSSLGRIAVDFLHQVVATRAFTLVELYDTAGRRFFTSEPQPVDARVAAALAASHTPPSFEAGPGGERVVMTSRLDNGPRCIVCHGDDHTVRGAVMVGLPNSEAVAARKRAIDRTVVLSSAALGAILVLLWALLHFLVVRPVRQIGQTAAAVGQGDLSVRVGLADPEGDEVRRLGTSINEMIQGLRAKFLLEKFVSRGAAAAAAGQGSRLAVPTLGERRHVTVLFSDIRGFTAYSERVAPEQVVSMLNAFLAAQAAVVQRHGGDVDKFVGDELMAVFDGADAARRAVRCAVEMLEAVEGVRGATGLAVGVGLSSGDVVYGPIGSPERMDFTVIGDVVNTGARLCSLAGGGQVVVNRAVVDACRGGLGDVEFEPLEPMTVKGKREPVEIYAVRRVGNTGCAG